MRNYIVHLRSHGCIMYAHIVIAVGKDIIIGKNSNLLYSNGNSLHSSYKKLGKEYPS